MQNQPDRHQPPDYDALVAAVRGGDQAAASQLVEALYPMVAGRISRLLARRAEVEDLAQDVFLRLFSRLDQYRGGNLPGWVEIITRRLCYNALRHRRVRPEWRFADLPEDPPEPAAAEATPAEPDGAALLARLFAMLPPDQALLLQMVEIEGRSISQVAADMGWTSAGGRVRLFRARRALERAYHKLSHETPTS